MIDRFTLEEFQSALPPDEYVRLGVKDDEWTFRVYCDPRVAIEIRSSVGSNGVAAAAGQDSIRLWLVNSRDGRPLAPKVQRWVTRVPGWQKRLAEQIGMLRDMRRRAGDCSVCHFPKQVFKSGTEKNPGRLFAKCLAHGQFQWLDEVKMDTGTGSPAHEADEKRENANVQIPNASSVSLAGEQVARSEDAQNVPERALAGRGVNTGPETRDDSAALRSEPAGDTGKVAIQDLITLLYREDEQKRGLGQGQEVPEPRKVSEPSAEQREAIEAPVQGAVRVLAGPGAGKTYTIARRYAFLVEHGVRPESILAVTFSATMAAELKARIGQLTPLSEQAGSQISTIHALCYRMLRANGDKRRVPKEWEVKRILAQSERDQPSLIERYFPREQPGYGEVLAWVNASKQAGYETGRDYQFMEMSGYPELSRLREEFDLALRQAGLITFHDMLLDVDARLKHDQGFLERWQEQFQHIIVDEGQDTSGQAMRILTTLAAPQDNFFIVGDPDQLLFRFTGATPEANLFEGFERRFPSALTVKLTTNYRSTREVVEAQLRLIAHNYEEKGGPYAQRYMKELKPRADAVRGEPVSYAEYDDPASEALAVTEQVKRVLVSCRPGDVFIGARTRAQLGYLEGPLVRAKIPYINIAGGSFWSQRHIVDVVAYMALAHDPQDTHAFKRVYNIASAEFVCPFGRKRGEYINHRYLGAQFLTACGGEYAGVERAAYSRSLWAHGVDDLVGFVQQIQTELAGSVSAALQYIVDNCYRQWLQMDEGLVAGDEAENGKLEDFNTLVEVASTMEAGDFIAYVKEAQRAGEAVKDREEWGEYVVLSTVHRLKGLERPVVIGVGLSEGEQVVSRAGLKEVQPRGLLPHTFSLMPPPQVGVLPTGGQGRVEDERCVAFVLVSRAQEVCYLTGTRTWRKACMHASRFVEELNEA